ncbi:MAG: dTDP-4-dehydrorhamnose 3,5-epimerase [Bacteroidales bacterium]|jgi:dTDP-4-dehydrorhamnose 3,5-epimerase
MGKLTITETPLKGLYIVETNAFVDHRGAFARWFCEEELAEILGNRHIKNVNFSRTVKKGSIRGMHFQKPPHAEMKLVRCIKGKVFDVAIDLRLDSKTYLQWHGVELSAEKMNMFVIPEGFAHGFQSLDGNVEMLYLHTEFYNKESEGALRYNDPQLNIQWPLQITELSEKDAKHSFINPNTIGVKI